MRSRFFLHLFIFLAFLPLEAQERRIYFDLNVHELSEEGIRTVKDAANACKTGLLTVVEGRAGSSGPEPFNLELSRLRAERVREALIREGCSPEKIITRFTGESKASPQKERREDRVAVISFSVGDDSEKTLLPIVGIPKFKIRVFDRISREPLSASVEFSGLPDRLNIPTEGIYLESGSGEMKISVPGYRDTSLTPADETDSVNLYLLPMEVEEIIVSERIYFEPNTARILPESHRTMDYVFKWLENRKNTRIEVHGHVNWPIYNGTSSEREKENQKLSEDRAEAVKKELVKRGIDKENITAKGFGSRRMIYPEAVSESQQAQNRRVEILIMAPASKER